MHRSAAGFRAVCLAFLLAIVASGCTPAYNKYSAEFTGLFDTVIVLTGYAANEAEFKNYSDAVFGCMDELHKLFDIYHEYEGANNLYTVNKNAGVEPVAVSAEIIELLNMSKEYFELSGGRVNIALGPVLSLWREKREAALASPDTADIPRPDELAAAYELCDLDDVIIDEESGTVFLAKPGMSLDVGAIAKGYAADQAVLAAKEVGAESFLLDAGGNICAVGKPMDGRPSWNVGIQNPDSERSEGSVIDTLRLSGAAMACSGDYQRFYTANGMRYHHIIDPETLMPANLYKQVAVIHESAATADALSTALFCLPLDRGRELAGSLNAKAMWVDKNGGLYYTDDYE